MSVHSQIFTGELHVGAGVIPPVSSATFEQSLDPTKPFSIHNFGVHQGEGIQNQLGVYNGLGSQNQIGGDFCIGFGMDVGGACDAQPVYDSSSPETNLNSPFGNLNQKWFYNGTPLDFLHEHSDIRLKKDIEPLSNSLDKILNLKGVSFKWNVELSSYIGRNGEDDIGFIAQEVENIIPQVVKNTTIPGIEFEVKNIEYKKLIPVLVEAIKEQQSQIEELKQTVQGLSKKLDLHCHSC